MATRSTDKERCRQVSQMLCRSRVQLRRRLGSECDAEAFAEALPPCFADRQGTGVALAGDPAKLEAAARERSADPSGEVRPALAPVQAGAAEHPPSRHRRRPEFVEKTLSLLSHFAAIGTQGDMAARGQGIGQGNAEPPGHLICDDFGMDDKLISVP